MINVHAANGRMRRKTLITQRRQCDAGAYFWANVPDDLSLLASGIQGCSAADMPEVPEA
jgi:hypothetical protein